ncbi:hypothetical protein HELRODRAFT_162269 [Helobdella robusta]|uniref:Uncharacterized protein n=1 Tax=Helobdella robusta TaxID=6412 RepID=T1ESF7_HELRO|nr:hypothetical protein HELRODRAFT_162269 [Helobdella robusta]ESN98808.1 hypothetical protein HELRODRAFT_162269 [Helobdella robusta]
MEFGNLLEVPRCNWMNRHNQLKQVDTMIVWKDFGTVNLYCSDKNLNIYAIMTKRSDCTTKYSLDKDLFDVQCIFSYYPGELNITLRIHVYIKSNDRIVTDEMINRSSLTKDKLTRINYHFSSKRSFSKNYFSYEVSHLITINDSLKVVTGSTSPKFYFMEDIGKFLRPVTNVKVHPVKVGICESVICTSDGDPTVSYKWTVIHVGDHKISGKNMLEKCTNKYEIQFLRIGRYSVRCDASNVISTGETSHSHWSGLITVYNNSGRE